IDDTAVTAEAALVEGRAHEDTVHRARIDAQRTKHALGVIDLEAVDAEALAHRVLDLLDVDAIDRARPGAFIAADARRQVEAVEAPVARLHRHRQLGIFKMLGERLALVRLQQVPQGDPQSLPNGLDRHHDIAEPGSHDFSPGDSCLLVTGDYMAAGTARKMKG